MNIIDFFLDLFPGRIFFNELPETNIKDQIEGSAYDITENRIYIGLYKKYNLAVLFVLLHELGHVWNNDGLRYNAKLYNNDNMKMEVEAWEWAQKTLQDLGLWYKYKYEFVCLREAALCTYKNESNSNLLDKEIELLLNIEVIDEI